MKNLLNANKICWLIALFPVIYMWYAILANNNGMRIFYFLYSSGIVIFYSINKKTGMIKKKILLFISFLILLTGLYIFLFQDIESQSSAILFSFMYFYMWVYGDQEFRNYYYEFLGKNEKKYLILLIFYYIGFGVSALSGSAISHSWGTVSLQGPYGLAHIFAYEMLLLGINAYLLYTITKKIKWIILALLNVALMILTSVRSTLLCLIVIVLYYFIVKKNYKKFVLFIIGCLGVYLLYKHTSLFSTVIEKTKNAAETGDITNARFSIWANSIKLFNESNFFHKLFGNGMRKLMDYNLAHIRMQVHAHNEFIDILSAYGILSFGVFMYVFSKLSKGENLIGFLLAFLVLAWFNGIYSDCSFVIGLISFRLLFEHINYGPQMTVIDGS